TEDLQCHLENLMDLFHSGHTLKICAPMVRYSKLAFRTLVRKYSCDLCYTPMIVAADFVKSVKARDSEFTTNEGDRPLIVQFAANESQVLADAACLVCPFADGIDLNCGCPQRWAMAEGYGACLINKPELIQDMVRQVRNQVENPNFSVSIKIRIHDDLIKTVDLCRKAEAAGVSWITVHGRYLEERHQPVHYDAIKIIKENISVPVVANGDVRNLKEAENVHQVTGADGKYLNMTFQWTVVASFLYAEVAILLILCIPFISPLRWEKIFKFQLWNTIGAYWNKAFLTVIVILIVLFLDAVREVKKYSATQVVDKDSKLYPNAYDHIHMKLFRSQRNLYISGFSLFLWLVLRRVIILITQLATEMGSTVALKTQVENTNEAVRKYIEENNKMKQVLNRSNRSEKEKTEGTNLENSVQEIRNLKKEFTDTAEALFRSRDELAAIKKQSGGLITEYDRLTKEHEKLQNHIEKTHEKKDQ
ncbi:B-cell receptor-associated protein 29-like, partial [Microcaecilia unicolor]|uniref:tRNA-dihydrouridine(20a/20b) synthase [NAD(P)+]-like n=1 Tax=Microcaecilia unicolor TaxID=1415580 RepID=A0A6P7Z5B3_9AMPH